MQYSVGLCNNVSFTALITILNILLQNSLTEVTNVYSLQPVRLIQKILYETLLSFLKVYYTHNLPALQCLKEFFVVNVFTKPTLFIYLLLFIILFLFDCFVAEI